jgi:uridine phosphorylase
MSKRKASGVIAGKNDLQYHIGCKTGDLASDIILVGDPQRALRISGHFDEITIERAHREYVTYTGKYKGFPISVMAIGIGQGNMEIAMIELSQIVKHPRIIRCGTSSGLQKHIGLGDMVVTHDTQDLGNLTSYYKLNSKNNLSHPDLQRALIQACEALRLTYHVGKTASAPGFYGPQGRQIPGFPISDKTIVQKLIKKKVSNLEMEMATMFSLASCKKIPVGGICSAIGNRARNDFLDDKGIARAEKDSIQCVLKAFEILNQSNTKKHT